MCDNLQYRDNLPTVHKRPVPRIVQQIDQRTDWRIDRPIDRPIDQRIVWRIVCESISESCKGRVPYRVGVARRWGGGRDTGSAIVYTPRAEYKALPIGTISYRNVMQHDRNAVGHHYYVFLSHLTFHTCYVCSRD